MQSLTPKLLLWIQMDMFLRNPRFVGLKFPDMSNPELIENKYQGKLTGHALSFLKGLLQMEPSVRNSALKKQSLGDPKTDARSKCTDYYTRCKLHSRVHKSGYFLNTTLGSLRTTI